MKTGIVFLVVVFFLSCPFEQVIGQTTYSVNPNPIAQANFLSLQVAIDSVPSGSILMVHGGNYGHMRLTKSLIIIGPGYFLTQNPETQATPIPAVCTSMRIDSSAAGSYVSGMMIDSTNYTSLWMNASGVVLQRNLFEATNIYLGQGVNSCIFKQNYIGYGSSVYGSINNTNMIFENNVIYRLSGSSISGQFTNNIFIDRGSSNTNGHPSNSIYQNNICAHNGNYGNNGGPAIRSVNGNVLLNNFFVSYSSPNVDSLNGNYHNIPATDLFNNPSDPNYETRWELAPSSPAVGRGLNGEDCGIFGGAEPYILSGIPFVPNIYELNVPFTGTSGSGIDVEIKVKANQ